MPLIALHRSLTTSLGIGGEGGGHLVGSRLKAQLVEAVKQEAGEKISSRRDAQRQAHLKAVMADDCIITLRKTCLNCLAGSGSLVAFEKLLCD